MKMLGRTILAAAALGAIVYAAPLSVMHSDQDGCSFGPVSNERYREYLLRAGQLYSRSSESFTWDNQKADTYLNSLFEQLINGNPSVYERIAAMHALLRSLGAEYRNTDQIKYADPYAIAGDQGTFVFFNYLLDVNRVGLFSPVRRQAWISTALRGPKQLQSGQDPMRKGDFRFHVNYPSLESHPEIKRAVELCPPVPVQGTSENFSLPAN